MTKYQAPKRRTIDARWAAGAMYPCRAGNSERSIERDVLAAYPGQPYATHGSVCADLLFHALRDGGSKDRNTVVRDVLSDHGSMVGTILVYKENVRNLGRVAKPLHKQQEAFRNNLHAVFPLAVSAVEKQQNQQQNQQETSAGAASEAVAEPVAEVEPEPVAEPVTVSVPEPADILGAHHQWSRAVRKIMREREMSWSMRPTIDGIALLAVGCPADGVRDSCLMDYPDDLRSQCGVDKPFDFVGFGLMEYLEKAASARVDDRGTLRPVCLMLVGPAGTGKTTAVSVLAERMRVSRYSVSMSAGTPLSAFYGRELNSGEVTPSPFETWAENGGLYLLDEWDCSEPNLLKITNMALANREYSNPITGRTITLCGDAIPLAGANTLGNGNQTEYSAAEQIDFSTADRFRAGRVRWELDEALEAQIVEAQIVRAA